MNMATKNDIFKRKSKEYRQANKVRKGEILDAVCEVSGLTRKGAIKRFKRLQLTPKSKQSRAGRPTIYTKDVVKALFDVWQASNQLCGELLHPMIREYVSCMIRDNQWSHGDIATGKLMAMSKGTVKRLTKKLRQKHGINKGKSLTKPSQLKTIIPIFKGPWDKLPPGEGQIDTVAHCGSSIAGDYGFTVSYIDGATYWIVSRMQWNKGQIATRESLSMIKDKLPMPINHLHPDTGSEFINYHIKDWCDQEKIKLTRSEPGKKNDNMYIEERNVHVVRKYLGYTRYDCPEVISLINNLYDTLSLHLNHFQTVRRTLTKERVGAKYRRTYENTAATPYQRLLARSDVSETVKDSLRQEHAKLNPLVLKEEIDRITSIIMKTQRDYGLKGLSGA